MPSRQQYQVAGHPLQSVVKWMAARGWTFDQAREVVARTGCGVTSSTIWVYFTGYRGNAAPAVLTDAQQHYLHSLLPSSASALRTRPAMRPTPRTPRVPRTPCRQRLARPATPGVTVDDIGTEYAVRFAHRDVRLVNKVIAFIERSVAKYDADNAYGGLASDDPFLADLIAQAKQLPSARFDAEGGIVEN